MAENETRDTTETKEVTPPEDEKAEQAPPPALVQETLPARKEQEEAQKALESVGKGDKRANAFNAIALMLKNMRRDLEGIHRTGQLPRWMRVARVREFNKEGAMNFITTKGVVPISGVFISIIGIITELALKAQELLIQADGGKALLEVGVGMIKTAASDEFYHAITDTLEIDSPGPNPLGAVNQVIDPAMALIDKIPDPQDVDVVAKELYLLLCIEQLALPLDAGGKVNTTELLPTTTVHIKDTTGKVRLLSWALGKPIPFHALNPKDGVEVARLGSRRVWETTTGLPEKTSFMWPYGDEEMEVYDYDYLNENAGADIQEANLLLEKLGYTEPIVADKTVFDTEFARRLRRFQKINDLPVTGGLDNNTINQLMNLDYEKKILRRAKPYSATDLPTNFVDSVNPTLKQETSATEA